MLPANAMSATPLLSVILTCRERGPALEATQASLAEQRAVDPEIIVADQRGGETLGAARNPALARARGDWILFLEAGEAGVAAGEMAYDSGRIAKLRSHVNPLAGDFVPRAATFYRRTVFAENGDFEVSLATAATYELHLRLWKNHVRFKPLPLRIAAAPAEPRFDWPAAREQIRVRHLYFPAWRCWWWDLRSMLRTLFNR